MVPVQTFHRYRLIRRIARGGMAEVFLAAHRGAAGFERRVALKKILPVYSGMEEFASLFKDEARVAAALDHSGIVQVYDFGEHTGEYYIAMEYVDGPDLEEVLERCRRRGILPPVEIVLHIGHRLAGCLEYAHSRLDTGGRPLRIIHRDVSPPNVLIGVQGEIKLTDFGVAKSALREGMTRPGVLRGKYAYMSPEQVSQGAMDHRSDLFSIGTVLYEALTGVNPFEGSTDYQTMESVEAADVEPAGFLRPDTPAELDRILVTCLEPDPEHRYQDAGSLRRDLADLMLEYPRSDDPQALVDFLQDVFPERSNADNRAALLDGSVPAWEMLAHRLSPMLVDLPPAPLGAPPIQLVEDDEDDPTDESSQSRARAIFREVGPKAKRKRKGPPPSPTEDVYVTDPGFEAVARPKKAPRGSFLPNLDDSLDHVSADSLPVLGQPDPEPDSVYEIPAPPVLTSLARDGDPLISDLHQAPPMTDAGVPIVNEWDLEDDEWAQPPRNPSSGEIDAVTSADLEPAIPSFGRVADVPHHSPMAADLFADDEDEDDDHDGDDDHDLDSDNYVQTQPSLSPASQLAGFAASADVPDADSLDPEDLPTERGGLPERERLEWDRLLEDAGIPEPDGGEHDLDATLNESGEIIVSDASLDDVAGALSTGTAPGAALPSPAEPPPAPPKAHSPVSLGLPTPRMMPARPRRARAATPDVTDTSDGWQPAGGAPRLPLQALMERATSGGTLPAAPAWPLAPEELKAWREEEQTRPEVDLPASIQLNPPSSPALKAIHGDFGQAPEPASLAPALPTPPQGSARPRTFGVRSTPGLDRPDDAPPLRIGRPPRTAGPSRPGDVVPTAGPAPISQPAAAVPGMPRSRPGTLNPPAGRPGEPAPPAEPQGGLIPFFEEHRQTLLLAALAVLIPLLLVFAAGTLDRDPKVPEPRETPGEPEATPRYVEPLSPIRG